MPPVTPSRMRARSGELMGGHYHGAGRHGQTATGNSEISGGRSRKPRCISVLRSPYCGSSATRDGSSMSIRDWPVAERPREKLLALGPAALSEAELLAIVIRNGRRGVSAVDIARSVLKEFRSLRGLLS